MENSKTPTEKLLEYIKSENFESDVRKWVDDQVQKQEKLEIILEKLHNKFKDRIDSVIEILIKNYEKNECDHHQELYWTLLSYAEKYGRVCNDEKYINIFTGEAYYIGSYVVQVMHGQGSFVRVDKV
jgi:hypothetical protein